MIKPRICAVITTDELLAPVAVEPQVDLYEVRLDLIGEGWRRVVRHLKKPWIACNRAAGQGGRWQGEGERRLEELHEAVALGASIVDVELDTEDAGKFINTFKKTKVECLVSYHDFERTPPEPRLRAIVQQEIGAGANICKVVTTAGSFADNMAMLRLIKDFPGQRLVAFAMGPLGVSSRILSPLVGGDFTYAAIDAGKESASGQPTVEDLTTIYGMLQHDKPANKR
ncbi:MAG: type I 3-dehydroquinate dehydratase [Dehalococcoidales bacterium]|nr:type I 3-dehydroquinate dehydratase [Dehalococcoidales bacterium]